MRPTAWLRSALPVVCLSMLACAGARTPDGPAVPPSKSCVDLDGDGYGASCAKGWDCDDHDPKRHDDCVPIAGGGPDWVFDGGAPDVYVPPTVETPFCPAGTRRVHIEDIWSKAVDPSLGKFDSPPLAVMVNEPSTGVNYYARKEAAGCTWYAVCLPSTLTIVQISPIDPTPGAPTAGCPANSKSGSINLGKVAPPSEVYIDYAGTSAALPADYNSGNLRLSGDPASAGITVCPPGLPDKTVPPGFTVIHFRWPWGNPDRTGFPGTACEKTKQNMDTPPFPPSILAQGGVCAQPLLEFQDGHCPWYTILVANSKWVAGAGFQVFYPALPNVSSTLSTAQLALPARTADEFWLAYAGPPDTNPPDNREPCTDYSTRGDSYRWYTRNPGPGYAGCGGGGDVPVDPCNPQPPADFSVVHFRYIWAGQKTFTFFPKPELMPQWIVMEIAGTTDAQVITCWREADRPWFNCPIPNRYFAAGTTWRAVDKTRTPYEWNTVQPRGEFPTAPGEYWLRWYYGKPDMPQMSKFKFYDYYPDGTNGDWSATGNWGDQNCAPKPPASPVVVGYPNAWFPYDETGYAYPFGASLARTFAQKTTVQDLLNAFVWERYQIWKQNYLRYDADACGAGTARVRTDPPETVSEGQGYGMAISAAIGDRETFGKLWNFVRHYLSKSAKKYCGGLMGWMWSSPDDCRPLDKPCDTDTETCSGNGDSAFDGDVDIAIGLVFAARQWPEYMDAALGWLQKMECEIDTIAEEPWYFPTPGDTHSNVDCSLYPSKPCSFMKGFKGRVNLSYYPPGYFRVFGDFMAAYLNTSNAERDRHRAFWYKTAESTYELHERCYDQPGLVPGLVSAWGTYSAPCSEQVSSPEQYDWSRALWRIGVDAAWFGDRTTLPENSPGSSRHAPTKTRMQTRIDDIQAFYASFHLENPPEPNANRFSTICQGLAPDGHVASYNGTSPFCDPGYGHNSYFVNTAMCAYASMWDDGGKTTPEIRREALEEAVSTTVENDKYYQESIGVYTMLFLSGNFPNPMLPPGP